MEYILSIIFFVSAVLSAADFYKMICLFAIGAFCLVAGAITELSLTIKKVFGKETENQDK